MKLKYQNGGDFPQIYASYKAQEIPKSKLGSPKQKSEKDTNNDVLDLLSKIEGLPNDATMIANNVIKMLHSSSLLGEQLSSNDLAALYAQNISYIRTAQFNKKYFEDTYTKVNNNGGLREIAITNGGKLVAQDVKTGKLTTVDPKDLKDLPENLLILTNSNLLDLRAKNPELAFSNSILQIVENGIGLETVNKLIQESIKTIGTTTITNEGYTKTQQEHIINGLEFIKHAYEMGADISGLSVDGLYESKILTKSQTQQAKQALNYIYNILPANAKTLLEVKMGSKEGALNLIMNYVGASLSPEVSFTTDLVEDKDGRKPGGDGGDSSTKEKSNPYLQLIRGEGGVEKPLTVVTKSGNEGISVMGTWYGQLPKVDKDMSIDALLNTGLLGIVENRDGITFGDLVVGSDALKDILYDNKGGTIATMPIKIDAQGNRVVNLEIIDQYKKALKQLKSLETQNLSKEQYLETWGKILKENELDELLDNNGLPNLNMFGQFLIVDGYTTDRVLTDTKSEYIQKVRNPDDALEEKIRKGLTVGEGDDKEEYDVDVKDKWMMFEWTYDDIYRSSVYIPIVNNPNAAINAWGDQWKEDNVSENEKMYQAFNKRKSMQTTSSDVL